MKIDFYKHNLTDEDINECETVLRSLFLTTGSYVSQFEEKFAQYMGSTYAVGVNSCTDALFLALKYFGIGPGDKVITTPMSFIASANAIEYCDATPVFVDVEQSTGNINADLIEDSITPDVKAIVLVHLYGQMCDMKKIRKIADSSKLKIIEDCAHCIEGTRDGVRPGQLGDIACFSFYATKNITSGEGGALTTNIPETYEWLKKARLHGMSKNAADRYTKKYEHYDMEFLGIKSNMSNIQASLLINQLDRIDHYRDRKEEISKIYDKGFIGNKHIKIPVALKDSKHGRHIYTIWVSPEKRDKLLHDLQDKGIGVAINFRAIHLMSYYKKKYGFKKGDFPQAERIGDSTLTLPLYPKLTDEEVAYIVDTVNSLTCEA